MRHPTFGYNPHETITDTPAVHGQIEAQHRDQQDIHEDISDEKDDIQRIRYQIVDEGCDLVLELH